MQEIINKHTAAVLVALITGLSGLGIALINKNTQVTQTQAENTYENTTTAITNLSEDIDGNDYRIQRLEEWILSNTTKEIIGEVSESRVSLDEPIVFTVDAIVPTEKRGKMPSFDVSQMAIATDLPSNEN